MCEMMSKGLKEALIVYNVLNVIYVEEVERGKDIYKLKGLEDYVMYTL